MIALGKFYEVRAKGERTRIFYSEVKALRSANGFTNRGKLATVYECREVSETSSPVKGYRKCSIKQNTKGNTWKHWKA